MSLTQVSFRSAPHGGSPRMSLRGSWGFAKCLPKSLPNEAVLHQALIPGIADRHGGACVCLSAPSTVVAAPLLPLNGPVPPVTRPVHLVTGPVPPVTTPVPPVTRPVPLVTGLVPPVMTPVPPVAGPVPPVARLVPPVSRPVQQVRRPVQPAMAVGRRRRGRGTARDQARKGVWENADSSCLWERGETLAGDLIGRPSSHTTRRPHQQQWLRLYQAAASGASGRGDGAAAPRCVTVWGARFGPPRHPFDRRSPEDQKTMRSGRRRGQKTRAERAQVLQVGGTWAPVPESDQNHRSPTRANVLGAKDQKSQFAQSLSS